MTVREQMEVLGRQARWASRAMANLGTAEKNACLLAMADAIEAATPVLVEANRRDLEVGRSLQLSRAMLDRLALDEGRVRAMAAGLREVAAPMGAA